MNEPKILANNVINDIEHSGLISFTSKMFDDRAVLPGHSSREDLKSEKRNREKAKRQHIEALKETREHWRKN